jgi:hypothetical protein
VPINDIIDEFGVPDYMKIDIEGNDRICISGLTCHRTPIVSIEMDHSASDRDLHILAKLGYQGFKVICQNNSWHQVTARNIGFYEWPPHHFIIRRLRKLRAAPSRGCGNGAMAARRKGRQQICSAYSHAAVAAGSPTGFWRMSGHPAVQQALRNHYFDSLGLPRLYVSVPA